MNLLLTILLVIGKLLLAVLLLALLLLLLVLSVPFRYQFDGRKSGGSIRGDGTVSYLGSVMKARMTIKKRAQEPLRRRTELILFGRSRRKTAKASQSPPKKEAMQRPQEATYVPQEAAEPPDTPQPISETPNEKETTKTDWSGLIIEKLHRGVTAVILFPIRLISKLFALTDRIRTLRERLRNILEFLTDPRFREALRLAGGDLRKLLSHIRPRTMTGHIEYGFPDPSVTGQVLAAASLLYPMYGPDFALNPDFNADNAFADGEVHISGQIRLGYVAYLAVTLLLNRNIRYVISRIRGRNNKEEETNG